MHIQRFENIIALRDGDDVVLIHPEHRRWYFTSTKGLELFIASRKKDFSLQGLDTDECEYLTDLDETLSQKMETGVPRRGCSIYVTNGCNMRCIHCRFACAQDGSILNTDTIKTYLTIERERGSSLVTYTGGEPLLRWDLIASTLPHAKELGFQTHLLTNGSLITDQIASVLQEHQTSIQVSLDTVDPSTFQRFRGHSLDPVLRGIDLLLQRKIDATLSCSLNRMTIDGVDDVLQFAIAHDIKAVHFPMLEKGGRAKETWNEIGLTDEQMIVFFEQLMKQYFCQGLRKKLALSDFEIIMSQITHPPSVQHCNMACGVTSLFEDGKIYGCTNVCGDARFSCGLPGDPADIRTLQENRLLRSLPTIHEIPECHACDFRWICLGGCRDRVMQANEGALNRPDPYCEVLKSLYLRLMMETARLVEAGQLSR
jgi:radical SAM protein with 4Fe4S-binding SPASM domain